MTTSLHPQQKSFGPPPPPLDLSTSTWVRVVACLRRDHQQHVLAEMPSDHPRAPGRLYSVPVARIFTAAGQHPHVPMGGHLALQLDPDSEDGVMQAQFLEYAERLREFAVRVTQTFGDRCALAWRAPDAEYHGGRTYGINLDDIASADGVAGHLTLGAELTLRLMSGETERIEAVRVRTSGTADTVATRQ